MNDRPADIEFADEHEDQHSDALVDMPADGEFEEAAPARRTSNGVPVWQLALIFVLILAAVGTIYLMFFGGKKKPAADDYVVSAAPAAVTQPVITESATNASSTGPLEQASRSQNNAPIQPVTAVQQISSAQPLAETRSGADIKLIDERLQTIEARIVGLEQTLASMNATIETIKTNSSKATSRVSVAPVSSEVNSLPAKKRVAIATEKHEKHSSESAPKSNAAEPSTAPSSDIDPSKFSITSIYGTRAWVVKHMPDGSEMEYSVVAGERLDGKLVAQVDVQNKAVVLQDGTRISTRY